MVNTQIPSNSSSGPQLGTFSYFHFNSQVHTNEKPYEILINLPSIKSSPEKLRRTNQEFEEHQVVVEDVRGKEDNFSLEKNGACWRTWEGPPEWHNVGVKEMRDKGNEWIERTYIGEVEKFIKREIEEMDADSAFPGRGVDFVKVFDYKVRDSKEIDGFQDRTLNLGDGLDVMIPTTHPHVDQSFDGAMIRVKLHMGKDADLLLKRRFRIVNVWKPLKPVTNWRIAICDTATVVSEDLATSDLVRRKYVLESFYATWNPNHRWYYLSNQNTNEVTMLQIHDSRKSPLARFSVHSSFSVGGVEKDGVRESFEVRAFVFDHED